MKKKHIAHIMVCMTLIGCGIAGCESKDNNNRVASQNVQEETTNISSYQAEYLGVTYSYELEDDRAIITAISPENGEKLVFPEELNGYKVVDLKKLNIGYKEVKFVTVRSGSNALVENTTIEKVSFYENVATTTYSLLEKCINIKEVEFPEGLTEVGNWLHGNQSLEKVVLSDTVTNIGIGAFSNCSSLKEINLANVVTISDDAFTKCKSLTNLDFSSTEVIGSNAFSWCTGLNTDIIFKKLFVNNLGANSFEGCIGLNGKTVTFETKCTITTDVDFAVGLGEAPFIKLYVNIIGLKYKADSMYLISTGVACDAQESPSFDKFYNDFSNWGAIEYDSVKCTPEKFKQIASDCFNNLVLEPDEELNLSSLKPIYDQIKDEGRETSTDPHMAYAYSAAKYRFTDALSQILADEELKTTATKTSDDGWVQTVMYDTINFNSYSIPNKTGKTIQFCISDKYSEDGEFYVNAFYLD